MERCTISGGMVTVAVDGAETTINFNLQTQANQTVTGQWRGELVDY